MREQDRPFVPDPFVETDLSLGGLDRKSTRLNSSHQISYAVFCLQKKENSRWPTAEPYYSTRTATVTNQHKPYGCPQYKYPNPKKQPDKRRFQFDQAQSHTQNETSP